MKAGGCLVLFTWMVSGTTESRQTGGKPELMADVGEGKFCSKPSERREKHPLDLFI